MFYFVWLWLISENKFPLNSTYRINFSQFLFPDHCRENEKHIALCNFSECKSRCNIFVPSTNLDILLILSSVSRLVVQPSFQQFSVRLISYLLYIKQNKKSDKNNLISLSGKCITHKEIMLSIFFHSTISFNLLLRKSYRLHSKKFIVF